MYSKRISLVMNNEKLIYDIAKILLYFTLYFLKRVAMLLSNKMYFASE